MPGYICLSATSSLELSYNLAHDSSGGIKSADLGKQVGSLDPFECAITIIFSTIKISARNFLEKQFGF